MHNNILFIVEGECDEVRFLKKLFETSRRNQNYSTYTYTTNIHVLAQILYDEYPDFDSDEVDIQLVLKSHENTNRKKELLSRKYKDVYLIFDFEPHHDTPHFDTLRRMISFFNDSTSRGKLYINYPMMQSYKHFNKLPDDDFKDKKIDISNVANYKQIVGEESNYRDLSVYSYNLFVSLTVHHLKKANYILYGRYSIPTLIQYLSWSGKDIYDKQYSLLKNSYDVFVLNTCIFNLIDYSPMKFYVQITTHESDYMI